MSGADEYSVIAPAPATATLLGKPVEITPLTIGEIPKFARAIRPLVGSFTSMLGGQFSAELLLDLAADHGDALIEAAALGSRVPLEDVRKAEPGEFFDLVGAVVRVNKDFLKGRLKQAMQAAMAPAPAAPASPGDGKTP